MNNYGRDIVEDINANLFPECIVQMAKEFDTTGQKVDELRNQDNKKKYTFVRQ